MGCDMFDMQIEYKISLASFSQEFQTIIIMTIDKLLVNTLEDSSVHNLWFSNYAFQGT